eukprot:snap_masked-scaffold_4-processed-gene-7.42-mRNA-1 protein AED:1.00 eAED:1.00 QI:0/0/0/0/1/1/2/0/86
MFSVVMNGIFYAWVVHAYEHQLRLVMIQLGYKIEDTFTCIKVSDQGLMLSSTDPHVNKAKKTCLMISMGSVSEHQIKSNFYIDLSG